MLEARLWMKKSNKNYLGKGRIELLERIREHGSIHAAAKAMKMSYKAAWDSVDAMNNLSETPLDEKVSGGKGGGGTFLTAKGEEVIAAFHNLQVKHQQFLDLFASSDDLPTIVQTLSRLSLKLSARNQLIGTIGAIQEDTVNVAIELTIKESDKIYSSLPVSGGRGTLSSFGTGTALQGKVHAKSGTIESVKCYAGYLELKNRTLVFAILVNNPDGTHKQVIKKMEDFLLDIMKDLNK